MSLFNFFKKQKYEFKPTNRIEELLIDSVENASSRPHFYRQLFHFDLLVLGTMDEQKNGEKALHLVSSEIDNEATYHVYTSEYALNFLVKKKSKKISYVGLNAISLFQLLANQKYPAGFVLNGATPFGKHFTGSEVKAILNDQQGRYDKVEIKNETDVLIGRPNLFPTELVKQLKQYIKSSKLLDDILFGQHSYNDKIAYLSVLDLKDKLSEKDIKTVINDLTIIVNELKISHSMDMTLLSDKYNGLLKEGALIKLSSHE